MSPEFQNRDWDYDQAQGQSDTCRWLITTSEGLTFRSCGVGDLEDMLHTIKTEPSFALTLERIDLSLAYDTWHNSRVVEFAEDWAADQNIQVDVRPDRGEDFESEAECESDIDVDGGDENGHADEEIIELPTAGNEEDNADSSKATESADGSTQEDVEPVIEPESSTIIEEEASFAIPSPSLSPTSDEAIRSRMHKTASEFALVKSASQIEPMEPIPEPMYLGLLQELLGVCSNVEVVVLPQRWIKEWRWAGPQVVKLRARPEEEEGPEYEDEDGDDYI